MRTRNVVQLSIIILFFLLRCAFGAEDKVLQVTIGAYPKLLHNFNYAANSFDINFYLWTITKNPHYNPKTGLEITNAVKYDIKNEARGENKDGSYYTTLHYYATCRHNWNITNFPFDRQILEVNIEDALDSNRLIFIADEKGSNIHPGMVILGWKINGFRVDVHDSVYASNLGDLSATQAKYSRFSFYIDIKREGGRLFLNYFIGFITSFILCVLIFFLRPNEIGKRINLSLGSIFTAIGNKFVLDGLLPPVNQFTLSDAIQLSTFGMILSANVITVITFELSNHGHPALAKKINHLFRYLVTPFFLTIIFCFLIRALLA